ncbi:uncharacterized protein [Spinacia oleracea]|uniref:Uncharacterized protein isoform X1 n=1 Tax=Spinacia oleracea TaxID=3562 RepID=A0ABM3QHQ2_SPIOL|nr:uncharacterized protein LOC110782925 isoform X1 [Spinacia oleracea]XP_056682895.1 uncharacterized protein LOC110782925 isoform X1 [Spinacia oleracea]
MSAGNAEASLQPKDKDIESQNERLQETGEGIGIVDGQGINHLKQLKSFEILKSALKIFKSNTKFMFLMILSILPYFVFMVFYEMKLQKSIIYASSNPLLNHHPIKMRATRIPLDVISSILKNSVSFSQSVNQTQQYYINYYDDDDNTSYLNKRNEFFSDSLHLCLFYLFLYPLLEFLSLSITTKLATEVHAAEKQSTLRELLHQKVNIKGPFITYLYVHLLSSMTLFGLFWIVVWNHLSYSFSLRSPSIGFVLYTAIQSVMFLALLYKFMGWSAFWNMVMVISFTQDLTGVAAFGLSDYYGRHCKKTGFHLMLGFFVFGNVLRLPCLYAGLCNGSDAGVWITCIVMIFVSIGNLVKWVAFVLYFYHCKQQTMEKKIDDQEQDKTVKAAAVHS